MAHRSRVHRFRDHPIAGVNWRPTRIVDELPSSHVCGLCRVISKRTVKLPCLHVLCQSCHAVSSQGGSGRCPLDEEPFEEAKCASHHLPIRTAKALQVYCWNEAHGCKYRGAMGDMLQHYEKECRFHFVECLRCGEAVLHRELATHCVAGCSVRVSSPRTKNTSSESEALTLEDVSNALEVKTLLREPNHDQVLPAIESQVNELKEQVVLREVATYWVAACSARVSSPRAKNTSSESEALTLEEVSNSLEVKTPLRKPHHDHVLPATESQVSELTEQVGNQQSRLAEVAGEVGTSVPGGTAEHPVTPSSTVMQESTFRQNPADEASTSPSLPFCSKVTLPNQEPEIFSNMSRGVLQRMQKTSTEDFPQHYVDSLRFPYGACHLTLTRPLSTTRTWKVPGTATYVVTLEHCTFLSASENRVLCRIKVLHTRDANFTVNVFADSDYGLMVTVLFDGVVLGARCLLPSFDVSLLNGEREEALRHSPRDKAFICDDAGASRLHFGSRFETLSGALHRAGCYCNGKVDLKILISQKDNTRDGHSSP